MKDFITPRERLSNPYIEKIIMDTGWLIFFLILFTYFIYNFISKIGG